MRAALQGAWEGPLFVVGMPRSGTKLLRTLVNQHPRIRIPEVETEFLPLLVGWVGRNGSPATEEAFQALWRRLRGATYFDYRSRVDWRAWRAACAGRFDAADLFEGFVRSELGIERGSGVVWGDKSPAYVRHVDLLLRHFPAARVVHIVRDVRDYCVSMRKAWRKDIRRAAWRWGIDVLAAHRRCQAEPRRSLEIHYEDLIATPEHTLQRIGDLCGLQFDSGMARLQRDVENLGDTRGRIEIVSGNMCKYRTALSPAELEAVESLAWDTMHAMGYTPERARSPRRMSALSQAARKIRDGTCLVIRDVERRGLARSLRFHLNHQRATLR